MSVRKIIMIKGFTNFRCNIQSSVVVDMVGARGILIRFEILL